MVVGEYKPDADDPFYHEGGIRAFPLRNVLSEGYDRASS